jgi:formate-dependent nitrite reductase membrane component NrfD
MSTPPNIPPSDTPNHPTYYNQPVIRSGHWTWQIIVYFWVGGIAGASYVIGVVANLFGSKEDAELGRWGRYVAVAGALISPILLIWDLGKPSRFLNMLRIIKFRSPMSIGTYGLVGFSGFAGISAVLQAMQDLQVKFPFINPLRTFHYRILEPLGTLLGLFMGGYTGVLISNTVVPLWARNYKTNSPVFLSSAFANAAAMLSLILTLTGRGTRRTEAKLAQIQLGATITEAALLVHELDHLGPYLRKPLTEGKSSPYFYGSVITGILLPLLIGNPRARWTQIIKAILTLIGGLLFRTAIIEGGHESADDPQAYHLFNEMEERDSST